MEGVVVEAVLFDLDGTLVDSREAVVWAVNELFKMIGRPPAPADEIISLIGVGLVPLLKNFVDNPDKYVDQYRDLYKKGFQSRTTLYRGAKEILELLKKSGVKIGVVTNRSKELSQVIMDYFALSSNVDILVGQEENSPLKPDPEQILKACHALGVKPENTLMVGDTEIDIETGKNAGSFTIKVDHEAKNEPTKADAIVYELPEVLKFLDAV